MERYVITGYVKMIAISLDDFESEIIDEHNTNYIQDIETFREKYGNKDYIKCMFIHVIGGDFIDFSDYKKVIPSIHPFDYMRDLIKTHNGNLLEESEDFTLRITDKQYKQKSIEEALSKENNIEQQ